MTWQKCTFRYVNFFNFLTGKSLSEALIFASTNPQYDYRLFIVHENCKLRIPAEHVVYTNCCFCFDIQNNFGTQHVLQMLRASEKNLPVLNNNTVHMQLLNFQTYPSPWQFRQRDHLKLKKKHKNYLKFVGKLFSFLLKFHLPFSVAVPASNAKNNQIFYLLETFFCIVLFILTLRFRDIYGMISLRRC